MYSPVINYFNSEYVQVKVVANYMYSTVFPNKAQYCIDCATMAADADIVSTFSLLPHLFRLSKTISAKQTDPQQQAQLIQNVVMKL